MVGDTDDEVRKKDVVDEECKSSFVHEKEITADVNGLVEKSIEVAQKIDFVMIERKKLAKLIEQADAVADLHQVLFKAEQVLLKTSAEINNARKQLNKLDENQHAEPVIDNETVSDFSRCF
uniref:Uncharacterized protein n=1 Tax=Ditylenchus dipsaci TaxID=166011 RepID=A0A915ELA3_9BILA